MKKMHTMLLVLFAIALLVCGCGGGGGGSSDVPRGENPGIPTVVQVQPTQYVAQTNSTLFVNAKVLDGNGLPIVNTPVVFTNLSLTGGTPSTVRAVTDAEGVARTTLTSSTPGFATVQAEISSGSGTVRDRKTVFFSSLSRNFPGPTMRIDIDGDGDGVFNEPGDFIIFENPGDRQILVRATVLDPFGQPVLGETVRFGADSDEVLFPITPLGNVALTDANGQANVLMEISPQALRPFAMTINVFAIGDFSGAANLVSIFLQPITVSSVVVSASPNPVESGDDAKVSAVVTTSTGAPMADAAVNFRTTNGGIDPFARTDANGVATVTFTAPVIQEGFGDQSATITATVAGVQGSMRLTIQAPPPPPAPEPDPPPALSVTPASIDITGLLGGTAVFTIAGGTPPYSITSSNPGFLANPAQVVQTGGTFQVAVGAGTTAPQSVTFTIVDGTSQVKTVILNVR